MVRADWWHRLEDGRLQCDLCPRACKLRDGQRGFCYTRGALDGQMVLSSWGRATGYSIDPIEKKPLYHFHPGSGVLSFGTAGCNLGCKYCQNWDISRARQDSILAGRVLPSRVAQSALETGCASIAFTYNDPIIFAEYALDCAREAHARGIKTVAVSNGYMSPKARADFYAHIDAANIDLKAFSESFYEHTCLARLGPVLDTLKWLARETKVWLEVTTLLIPGYNDSEQEIDRLSAWFVENLGPETPLHFTAFHPDFQMLDVPRTPLATLRRARNQAKAAGIKHVYTGNVHDPEGQSSYCAGCGQPVIGRENYEITAWRLDSEGRCSSCREPIRGHFSSEPARWGAWRRALLLSGDPAAHRRPAVEPHGAQERAR